MELLRIHFRGSPQHRRDIRLNSDEVVVGRSAEATCCIPDPLISRQHVRLVRQLDTWTVTDLSMNGVLVNGARLVRGEPSPLRPGDELQLDPAGQYRYRVAEDDLLPPPVKRALATAEHQRRVREEKERLEAKLREENEQQLQKMQEEKERLEAKLKEEKDQLEARLRQVQEELRGQQEQAERERELAERAAQEREEYATSMASLKEEMEKKEREMEDEKRAREERLRLQLQEQEAALKAQLSAEVSRLQQERDAIEHQLKEELVATNKERQQTAADMQARCAAIETQLGALDAKRELLETQLAATEREKEAACGQQLAARQSVLDGFDQLMDAELTCSVCSELFFNALTLNCTHTFCASCINEWTKHRPSCPICREPVTSRTRSLVLDNFIDGMVARLGGQAAEHRATVRREPGWQSLLPAAQAVSLGPGLVGGRASPDGSRHPERDWETASERSAAASRTDANSDSDRDSDSADSRSRRDSGSAAGGGDRSNSDATTHDPSSDSAESHSRSDSESSGGGRDSDERDGGTSADSGTVRGSNSNDEGGRGAASDLGTEDGASSQSADTASENDSDFSFTTWTHDRRWSDSGDSGDASVDGTGAYYGGYGRCYVCGRRGHWAPGCPFR
ncbi:E3 ubiquitin-protein ligase rnf8-like [Pollicipes pollicipes]|uniref:E3 ubiquitin-protein ligase rnf8-like n=1 Tax=Pollicipes pollicipes TaxID=41117 RepID=UPI001884F829|nr:E3 ubiquitin-protein ligase rnf8-like [Pollicipes pollicipes]